MTEKDWLTVKEAAEALHCSEEYARQRCRMQIDSHGNKASFPRGWSAELVDGHWRIYPPAKQVRIVDALDEFSARAATIAASNEASEAQEESELLKEARRDAGGNTAWIDSQIESMFHYLAYMWRAEAERFAQDPPKILTGLDQIRHEFTDSGERASRFAKAGEIPALIEPYLLISKLALAYKFAVLNGRNTSVTITFSSTGAWSVDSIAPDDEPRFTDALIGSSESEKIMNFWLSEIETLASGESAPKIPSNDHRRCVECGKLLQRRGPRKEKQYCSEACKDGHRKWVRDRADWVKGARGPMHMPQLGQDIVRKLRKIIASINGADNTR